MVNKELRNVLKLLGVKLEGFNFSLLWEKDIFNEILTQKQPLLQEFIERITLQWDEFTRKNEKRIIKKTYTTFFYHNLYDYLKYFLPTFYGFDENSLELVIKEKVSDTNLFLELTYNISSEEIEIFEKFSEKLTGIQYSFYTLIGYLFFTITELGILLKRTIQEKILVLLDSAIMIDEDGKNYLKMMIIVKKNNAEHFTYYYNMALYYFLKQFKGIPEDYFKKLLDGREKLYQVALQEYGNAKEKLVDLLYYFYKKCKLLHSVTPLLDFINFVGSRVEDSIYSKIDIIKKDFLVNFDYSEFKKNSIVRIFDFLDKKSTLFSTFQANNLPSPKAQFNLFLLYMKYYFGSGLEDLEVGDLLYLPEIFITSLNQYNKESDNVINANTIKNIGRFMNFFSILSNIDSLNMVFKKILHKSISNLNYTFFMAFLKSFNSKLFTLIEQENETLSENFESELITFNIIVDHTCRILYTLIEKIFLKENPEEASENFIDPRGRYIGKNIALRVLELFIFQEINFSDDIWPEYLISLKKRKVKDDLKEYLDIPDKHFYSIEDLTKIILPYSYQFGTNKKFFEEWLISEIIIPLNDFILNIRNSVKDPKNNIEVYEKLSNILLDDITEKEIIQEFKFVCQQLAPFWESIQ